MKFLPRDYQTQAVESLFKFFEQLPPDTKGHPLIAMPTGCHAKGHPILMADGSIKNVEDIRVFDQLMGPDSKPRTVLQLARGRQEMRLVIPNRAEPFIVNLDHKLLARVTKQGGPSPLRQSRDEVITIRGYENGSDWYKHLRKLQFGKIDFPQAEQPIPSYILGILLGDGCLCNGGVSLTTADQIVEDEFTKYTKGLGLRIRSVSEEHKKSKDLYAIDPLANRSTPNRLTSVLRDLDVMEKRAWQKIIPSCYKVADREQRLEILAGLLDTDGFYDQKSNYFEYCTVSKQLAEDVKFIVRSLGLRGQIKRRTTNHRDAYIISITGDLEEIPTRITRKRAKPSTLQKDCKVMGFKVEKLPEDDYYGFTLDKDQLYLDGNFVIHHNTGKAVVIGLFLMEVFNRYPNYQSKVVIATHVKELVKQNYVKLLHLWPSAPAGVNSEGLKQRDTKNKIIFAGIGSVINQVAELGFVDLLIVDEAHLISMNDKTMYMRFIKELQKKNPHLRVIGLTATKFRMGQGELVGEDTLFTDICFDITDMESFNRLLDEGYLSLLLPKPSTVEFNLTGVGKVGGDYNQGQLQKAVDKEEITRRAIAETVAIAEEEGRKHWLIFASGIDHCQHISDILDEHGISNVVVHSKMKDAIRDENLSLFTSGQVTCAINFGVLTTGFDYPEIDLIPILRPTESVVLWIQMLGRGTRPLYAEGYDLTTIEGRLQAILNGDKPNCRVLDFARNTQRLGPINDPKIPRRGKKGGGDAPVKLCPVCDNYNHASVRFCINCGSEFIFQNKLIEEAGTDELIKSSMPIVEIFKIDHMTVGFHPGKGDKPPSMKCTYFVGKKSYTEYVCFLHESQYTQRKAKAFWDERTDGNLDYPTSIDQAIEMSSMIRTPTHMRVWTNKKFPEIMNFCYDGKAFGHEPEGEPFTIPVEQDNLSFFRNLGKSVVKKDEFEDDDIPF